MQTAGPGERMSLGLKVTPDTKNRLDTAAKVNGRTQSQEAEARLERSFENEGSLDQAMTLAYGADNAGLIALIGEVLRIVTPRGEWLDNDEAFDVAASGIIRALKRLRAPNDGKVSEGGPDYLIDELLWDLGDDGSDHPGPLTARQRWAVEKRHRFGETLSARLKLMRQVVREAAPPREMPDADPKLLKSWDRAFANATSRRSKEG